jgi:hypothetical protein
MAPKAKVAVLKRPAAATKAPVVLEHVEEEDEAEEEAEEEEEEEENEEDQEDEEEAQAIEPPVSPKRFASKTSPTKSAKDSPLKAEAASPIRSKPGCIEVSYTIQSSLSAPLAEGLVQLRRRIHRCDAAVIAGGGARIPVHSLVLASQSADLDRRLENGPEIDLGSASHEAADHLVRWMYGEIDADTYAPSSTKINEEVLRLASEFGLPLLAQICSIRLAVDVSVTNVVERIRLCEAYGLPELRHALVAALVQDRKALETVSRDEAALQHPALLRELLALIARKACEEQIKEQQGDEAGSSSGRPSKVQRV